MITFGHYKYGAIINDEKDQLQATQDIITVSFGNNNGGDNIASWWGVMQNVDKEKILNIVLNTLTREKVEQSIIYLDCEPFKAGDTINSGRMNIDVKKPSYMAFVDLQPRLNWGHPCMYVLIDSETFEAEIFDAQFPPYQEDYPQSYIVLLRYGVEPPDERYFNVYD
jgi:hypothetical protein